MPLTRRAALATGLSAPFVSRVARAETVVRMGTLKLIHAIPPYFYERFVSEGMKVEVIAFESPTDGKAAVVTGSIDFGTFGIAAAIQGAAAREPLTVVGSVCNKGMGVVARKEGGIDSLKDLRGRRVAIWPGSTQEASASASTTQVSSRRTSGHPSAPSGRANGMRPGPSACRRAGRCGW